MFTSNSLLKTALHNSLAEGIYNEISTRQSRYYYFLGKTLTWSDELSPPSPTDTPAYDREVRRDLITLKEIGPTDVAFVIPRYNWVSNTIYDQYDDELCSEVISIDLISGGSGYTTEPNVYVGDYGADSWTPNTSYAVGTMVVIEDRHYIVKQSGISTDNAPVHTSGTEINGTTTLQYVDVTNGNGTGATAIPIVSDGVIVSIQVTSRGNGYTSTPSITIGGVGTGATAVANVPFSATGKQRIEDCIFYVMNDEYNVYQCLDNNLNSRSTYKPTGTSVDPIQYPDGYIWKFMYGIPAALRNKFLTEAHIPVTNSLRNQFYSSGKIQYIRIDRSGANYNYANLIVTGDGHLESDPVFVDNYTITNAGSGLSSVSINVAAPFSGVANWGSNRLLQVGTKVSHNNNYYEAVNTGTTGTVAPSHRIGTVVNGNVPLKYVGTKITGTVTLSGGQISSISFKGMIRDISVIENGSGYNSPPTITISGGGGTNAVGIASMQSGQLSYISVADPGLNYTSIPSVIVGTEWTENTALTLNQQVFVSSRLYTVTTAGTTGTTAPTHVSGTVANGTAQLQYAGIAAKAIAEIKYGSGYQTIPTATISKSSGTGGSVTMNGIKSEAKIVPILSGKQIIGAKILDGGVGYSYATITVSGDGANAQLTPDLFPGDIDTLQANVELLTVNGAIVNCPVTSGGFNYGFANVNIIGDGTGATATATLVNGRIGKINMTNYGSGYTWARVEITGGANSHGATARAIISPYGGYGKDSVNDLFARTLMFYSNISSERNQGFVVNNDYRQTGIIKNPKQFGGNYNLDLNVASACWVVSANNNVNLFTPDSIIYLLAPNSPRFRIVSNTGASLLLQSLDNAIPQIGSQFVNENNDTIFVTSVAQPTVDKYSGDLLYIDNRKAFTPSENETISLRTVIRF